MGRLASAITGLIFVVVCIVLLCFFWTSGPNYFKNLGGEFPLIAVAHAEMQRESIIVGGQVDHIYIDDGLPPSAPTGVRVIESGQMEQEFEDYAPTGNIRMRDGQQEWIEYDINLEHPEEGGSIEGRYYE